MEEYNHNQPYKRFSYLELAKQAGNPMTKEELSRLIYSTGVELENMLYERQSRYIEAANSTERNQPLC